MLSATELYQLVKLPFLVTHYKKHKQDDPKTSLWSFLSLHYANGEVFDKDHDEDMKLPFKTNESAAHVVVMAYMPPAGISVEKPVFIIQQVFKLFNESFHNDHFLACIWQPPKTC